MKAQPASLTRTVLFSGAASAALSMVLATPAAAQDQTDAAGIGAEEIFVTGSLIARDPNAAAPVPVQSIGGDDIRLTGETDIAAVLRNIPSLSASIGAEASLDSGDDVSGGRDSNGQSTLNLRGLGVDRTLVVVDGRRHVSGLAEQQAVDIGSIPAALIERVEVLTGGASALYGADAVTGVVNFVLKKDFEGLQLDASAGLAQEGDGERFRINGLYGKNFGGGRGNVTVSAFYNRQTGINFGDRDQFRNNGEASDFENPNLQFQQNDISATSTPNFAAFFSRDAGRFPIGEFIPTGDAVAGFISDYTAEFGSAPVFTSAEQALIDRATGAPLRLIAPNPTFPVASNRGNILAGDGSSPDIDLNGNGINDCLDSYQGFQSSGFIGGCWVVGDNGAVRPFRDGLVTDTIRGFGGDGSVVSADFASLTPDRTEYGTQMNLRYDFSDNITGFFEGKYVRNETSTLNPGTFWDLLFQSAENPFIPAELQALADTSNPPNFASTIPNQGPGLFITRDPLDLFTEQDEVTRETYRFVAGIEGELDNGWTYEVSGNYGRTNETRFVAQDVVVDRYFAAIDVVEDANGNPVCRSDIDPNAISPVTPFDIPVQDFGYFTFTPGDGQCQPLNLWGGINSASDAARNFVTAPTTDRFTLEQTVFRAVMNGDTSDFLELPAGPIGFAIGAEYRDESATSTFDPLTLGILPVQGSIPGAGGEGGSLSVPAGTLLSDIEGVDQTSLVFDPEELVQNSGGGYDVWDVYAEVEIPLISGKAFAEDLTIGGSMRYSDYSTIGGAFTWGARATWAPVESLRFRATYSKAVRAPNIFELFAPEQGTTFDPNDPCIQSSIDALNAAGDPLGATREAACRADGIPEGFTNPNTARFSGVQSGNPDLIEETSRSYTIGAVLQPTWFEGFTLSVDYWNIDIENAIAAPSGQDIVNACYSTGSFPNQFCSLIRRDPADNGLDFIAQAQVNFGSIVSNGVDIASSYDFAINEVDIRLNTTWSYTGEINQFFDPLDPTAVDPELRELQRPRWAGSIGVSASYKDVAVNYSMFYYGSQGLGAVDIETVDIDYGAAGIVGASTAHNISATYQINDTFRIYGSVNNLLNRRPFITEQAYPVSPLGRFFSIGVTADIF